MHYDHARTAVGDDRAAAARGESVVKTVFWVPIILIVVLAAAGVYWAYWYGELRSKKKQQD